MSPRDALGRGQTILLLGGHSDIGRAIVRRMVDDGARRVILGSRDPDRSMGSTFDAEVDHRYFDATDSRSHKTFFEEVFDEYPSIDTVVVAFGMLREQNEVMDDPALGVEMAEVNYVGALSSLLHVTSRLRDRGEGAIVLLSSVAGALPRKSNFVYGSSKAGIDFMARGLASTLRDSNIAVLVVRPGFVHSAMTQGKRPRPFAVSPETVAKAVTDGLARQESAVVWVPDILRWVMGVLRLLPSRVVDRLEG